MATMLTKISMYFLTVLAARTCGRTFPTPKYTWCITSTGAVKGRFSIKSKSLLQPFTSIRGLKPNSCVFSRHFFWTFDVHFAVVVSRRKQRILSTIFVSMRQRVQANSAKWWCMLSKEAVAGISATKRITSNTTGYLRFSWNTTTEGSRICCSIS